jgi:hypothetical protein
MAMGAMGSSRKADNGQIPLVADRLSSRPRGMQLAAFFTQAAVGAGYIESWPFSLLNEGPLVEGVSDIACLPPSMSFYKVLMPKNWSWDDAVHPNPT